VTLTVADSTGSLLRTRTVRRMDRKRRLPHRAPTRAPNVQIAARHADPRTTTRYDRARGNLDRHANYVVSAFIAGAA